MFIQLGTDKVIEIPHDEVRLGWLTQVYTKYILGT